MARFVGKSKLVNENWAAKLIDSVPPAARKERVVWCDGGGGPTGHPKIFINLVSPPLINLEENLRLVDFVIHKITVYVPLVLGQTWESCLHILRSPLQERRQPPLRIFQTQSLK